ncbi:hypothetical protein HRG_009207 [Hirsutella rhossiliensis]|uniref:Uncharacterized protein n=1 Tax=Hirsutella rhossiliensis TaxID=111463 RepID=A0A9P8MQH3_9HYPO|nr:uncharacterized protein HRG_09207 [Hirsutella rhossiliensis]KAH0959425.1 hypothetical protein HRG_09207 [Hirsutella rhossiliensis]
MAFQQPTRQVVQRVARPATVDDHGYTAASPECQPVESQSWVLFSAPTDVTTTSYLSGTDHSLLTPGRSLLSDLGSLNTVARSAQSTGAEQAPSQSAIDDASVEDDAELDSLDSHLPEFRSLPGAQEHSQHGGQHSLPVLPAHDGLGSFRLSDQPVLGRDAQDHIYQFERFNPRRVRRRLDSFSRGQLDLEHSQHEEEEKRLRIEAWRLDHSRMLVDQVQRETRRRRKSQASMQRVRRPAEADSDNMTWHDEDHVQPGEEEEGVLASITRKVVRDLLGIDDTLLSLLLGESLPDDTATPTAPQLGSEPLSTRLQEQSWHPRLLETLSRELGLLVNCLSHHPGAFSTFARTQQLPLPYAGLPVILESGDSPQSSKLMENERPSAPDFQPTMQQSPQPARTSRVTSEEVGDEMREDAKPDNTFTQEEWEKDLDVKLVFKYLMSRFSGRPKSSSSAGSSHGGTPNAQDSAAKISRVRQHHPLIARSRPVERRAFKASIPANAVALRHPSSCASQSTRRSARRSSCSSRHYWDIGGSMGTGSVIASHGPMGSWGEV